MSSKGQGEWNKEHFTQKKHYSQMLEEQRAKHLQFAENQLEQGTWSL